MSVWSFNLDHQILICLIDKLLMDFHTCRIINPQVWGGGGMVGNKHVLIESYHKITPHPRNLLSGGKLALVRNSYVMSIGIEN